MSDNVIELGAEQQHWTFNDPVTGNVHVVPDAVVARWETGSLEPDIECVRAIIESWRGSRMEMKDA